MSYHYQTKVSRRGNPFSDGFTFREILENMKLTRLGVGYRMGEVGHEEFYIFSF